MDHANSRRQFGRALAAIGAGLAVAGEAHAANTRTRTSVKPPRLRAGDTVGIVTPSGHVDEVRIARCASNLEKLGLKVKYGQHLRAQRGNFAGPVAGRVDDLHAMFADPEVKAVWAAHGGSGAINLLAHLDYRLIRRHPKIFAGYSDVTALLLAIHRHTGMLTFHAPNASSNWSDFSVASMRAVLMDAQPQTVLSLSPDQLARGALEPDYMARSVHDGVAEGRLVGGNLSLLAALAGTPHGPDLAGAIVFAEDIHEAPYRVDRMLAQVGMSAGFSRAKAVMLGVFEKCGPPDSDPSLSLQETVDDHLLPLKVPAVYGYSFGHIRDQVVLPIGASARLDTYGRTLTLLERAVAI